MHPPSAILIVDDDPNICKSLAAILGKKGHHTQTARSGEEALAKAGQRSFELALLDIRLSDVGGVELISQLKELHPDMAVIMVTAHGSVQTAVQAMNAGASAYIMKPFGIDEVLAAVDQALERRRLLIENKRLYEAAQRELADRKRAEEALRQKNDHQEQLLEVARELASSLDTSEVLRRIITRTKGMLDASGCVLYLLEPDERTLRPVACDRSAYEEQVLAAPLDIERSLTGQAVKARRGLIFNDASTNPLGCQIPGTPEQENERVAVAPLMLEDRVLGALCVNRLHADFGEEDLALAEAFAAYAATAIRNAQTHETLRQESDARRETADTLEKEREYYRSFLESLTDWAWEMDTDGVHTYSNRAVEDLLGYAVDEVVGRHVTELWLEEDRTPESLERLRRSLAAGEGWRNVIARFNHRSGSARVVESTAIPMLGAGGQLLGYRGIDHNITERRRAEEALRESEERFRELVQRQGEGIGLVDEHERFTFVNPAAEEVFGLQPGELVGRSLSEFVDKETWATIRGQTEIRRRGEASTYDLEIIRPDGEKRQIVLTATPRHGSGGAFAGTLGIFRDITERKRAELALEASVRFLRIANRHTEMDLLLKDSVSELKDLTGCSAVGIRILDDDRTIPYQAYNGFPHAFYELESPLSITSDSCMCVNVIKGETDPSKPFYTETGSFYMNGTTRFLATVSEGEKGKTRNACNEFGYESVALIPIRLADQLLGLIHIADPREDKVPLWMVRILEQAGLQLGTAIQRVSAQAQLAYAASHDPLTKLANRQLLAELFASEVARAKRSGRAVAVMYLDLDHFKDVNDTLGHTMGDALLCAVAGRLREVPRMADSIARLGGDEFVVAVPEVRHLPDAVKVAKRILRAVRQPFKLDGPPIHITTSLGIAFYPRDGEDLDTLLRAADVAMYRAKNQGRDGFQVYRPDPTLEIDSLRADTHADASPDPQARSRRDSKQTDGLRDAGHSDAHRTAHRPPDGGRDNPR